MQLGATGARHRGEPHVARLTSQLDRAELELLGRVQPAQVAVRVRHVVIALRDPVGVSRPLIRRDGELVQRQRFVAPAANVGDRPEVVRHAGDEQVVAIGVGELERGLEITLGALELAELHLRDAREIERATEIGAVAGATQRGNHLRHDRERGPRVTEVHLRLGGDERERRRPRETPRPGHERAHSRPLAAGGECASALEQDVGVGTVDHCRRSSAQKARA